MKTNRTIEMISPAIGRGDQLKPTLTECLRNYLETLEKIEIARLELRVIEEEVIQIPGVEKRPFKSLAKAMHDATGEIKEKMEAMKEFIEMAFKKGMSNNQEIEYQ